MSDLRYLRAGAEHSAALLELFEAAGTGCFCNYWHFTGDKNAWLEQCYLEPELNRAALVERLASDELCGVVALRHRSSSGDGPPRHETASPPRYETASPPRYETASPPRYETASPPRYEAAGWLKLSRAASIPRLYEQRVYRGLPCFGQGGSRSDVYAIGCSYVAEPERRRGVLRALLSAAITEAKAAGATALEAFPRGATAEAELRADQLWLGPEALFLEAGFETVSDFRAYPVLRLHLR